MHRISVEFRPIINKIAVSNPERNSSRGLAVPEKTGHIIPEILRDEVPFIDEITLYTVLTLFFFFVSVVILFFINLKKKKTTLATMTSHRRILKLTIIAVQDLYIRQVKPATCLNQSIYAVQDLYIRQVKPATCLNQSIYAVQDLFIRQVKPATCLKQSI